MISHETFQTPKLKVLILTPAMAPGGAEQHVATLVRHANAVNYVGVMMLGGGGRDLEEHLPQGCPLLEAPKIEGATSEEAMVAAIRNLTFAFDLILYWGFKAMDLDFTGVPVVHLSHCSGVELASKGHRRWMEDRQSSLAHFHVAVCESGKESFPEAVRDGLITVIHNGADLERTRPGHGRQWQRDQWGVPEGVKLLLYVGRFFTGKGAETVIEAMHYLPDDYALVCYGWGDQTKELHKMASGTLPPTKWGTPRVYFPRPKIKSLGDVFAAADCVVIPSKSEAFPLVMVEAWHSATPLVCSEFMTLGECERLYNSGAPLAWHIPCPPTPKDVAEGVLSVHPDNRINDALEISFQYFTASAMVARWEAYFHNCIQQWRNQSLFGITLAMPTAEEEVHDDSREVKLR